MNVALIHDKLLIKQFWEKKIDAQSQEAESEEDRRSRSALSKLREEWLVRLEARNKHLKNLKEDYVRKVKTPKSAEET